MLENDSIGLLWRGPLSCSWTTWTKTNDKSFVPSGVD